MQATAKDLRIHTKELIECVNRGEEVIITFRGKKCARLVPFQSKKQNDIPVNPLRGIWKNHAESEDVNAYMDQLRKGRKHDR